MATYNGEKYVAEQLHSILAQLSENDEVIISDDGSTDNTLQIISGYKDPRIRCLQNTGRKGVVGNFENALSHATGDIIFLSDQDDIWEPTKVQVCVQALQNSLCVLHNAQLIDADGNVTNANLFAIHHTRTGYWHNLWRNTFVGCCMAFRSELLQKLLPIPASIKMHDIWIALLASRYGKVILVPQSLIRYRRHMHNASSTATKSQMNRWTQIKYRLQILWYTQRVFLLTTNFVK